jgi:class 3 adenylate cyclase/CheY-like chemotaxis protein
MGHTGPVLSPKILSIGDDPPFHDPAVRDQLTALGRTEFRWFACETAAEALEHFFSAEPIQLLLVDEAVEGLDDLLASLKEDEVFQFLPVILLLDEDTPERRHHWFPLGVEHFLGRRGDPRELVRACHVALRYKLQLDSAQERLRMVTEENITRAIQLDILQKYVPQTVWEWSERLADEQDFALPEGEADLAIVFADLKSFTTRAEKLAPEQVLPMLNSVFDVAARWVYAHGGDVDKFIGDAFFAVFASADDALAASLRIQEEMAHLSPGADGEPLQFRVGVHWGRVIRGSVGGTLRWDHTLIGDVVNTAQRLESNAPPGGILASRAALEATGRALGAGVVFQTFALKGKGTKLEAAVLFPGDEVFFGE